MNYCSEVKRNKCWVTFINLVREQKTYKKMIKFFMPKQFKFEGQVIANTADNARLVWDKLYEWKYGKRVEGMDVMINIDDINRAIHTKINFVSLIDQATGKTLIQEPAPKSKCKVCGTPFTLTPDEIQFYRDKGYQLPKRCEPCRLRAKQNKPAE